MEIHRDTTTETISQGRYLILNRESCTNFESQLRYYLDYNYQEFQVEDCDKALVDLRHNKVLYVMNHHGKFTHRPGFPHGWPLKEMTLDDIELLIRPIIEKLNRRRGIDVEQLGYGDRSILSAVMNIVSPDFIFDKFREDARTVTVHWRGPQKEVKLERFSELKSFFITGLVVTSLPCKPITATLKNSTIKCTVPPIVMDYRCEMFDLIPVNGVLMMENII